MSRVALLKCEEYDSVLIQEKMIEAMNLLGLEPRIFAGKKVAVKPNLLSASAPEKSVVTHPEFFRPGLWLAADATLYSGGRTTIDGVVKDDRQENSRADLTLSIPIGRAYSLKFTGSTGMVTRIGGKFTVFGVAFQYRWFDR